MTEKLSNNSTYVPSTEHLKPHQWKRGQSGNPKGRPKGKTMKEWVKDYLERMTDEERDAFIEGIPKEVIWKMAEGNPTEDKNISITAPRPILGGTTQGELPEITHKQALDATVDAIEQEVLGENTQ